MFLILNILEAFKNFGTIFDCKKNLNKKNKKTMKNLVFIIAFIFATTVKAELETIVSASINPTHYYIDANNQDPHTIITWNDATIISSILLVTNGQAIELSKDTDFFITTIDSLTSKLSFRKDLNNLTKKADKDFFDWSFLLEFDFGNPCIFTIVPEVEIYYEVHFLVMDQWENEIKDATLTFDGVVLIKGDYFAGNYTAGTYHYNIKRIGFQTYYDTLVVTTNENIKVFLTPNLYTNINDNLEVIKNFYPNPTTDLINLEFNTNEQKTIQIYSLNGKVIKELVSNENQISLDVSNFDNGMYLIKTSTKNQTQVSRFLKK